MTKIRNFVLQLPYLCGVKDPERWSKVNELVFDYENQTPGSVFAEKEDEFIDDRASFAFGFCSQLNMAGDVLMKVLHCRMLLNLAMASHAFLSHERKDLAVVIENYKNHLQVQESVYPDVQKTFSVSDASTLGTWA